jgi:hypothetical protein
VSSSRSRDWSWHTHVWLHACDRRSNGSRNRGLCLHNQWWHRSRRGVQGLGCLWDRGLDCCCWWNGRSQRLNRRNCGWEQRGVQRRLCDDGSMRWCSGCRCSRGDGRRRQRRLSWCRDCCLDDSSGTRHAHRSLSRNRGNSGLCSRNRYKRRARCAYYSRLSRSCSPYRC